jgi:hypothetical protein
MNGDWSKTSGVGVNDEEPIREELFSIERLEQYVAMLADEHQVSERPRRGQVLLPRFEENGRYLFHLFSHFAAPSSSSPPCATLLSFVPAR